MRYALSLCALATTGAIAFSIQACGGGGGTGTTSTSTGTGGKTGTGASTTSSSSGMGGPTSSSSGTGGQSGTGGGTSSSSSGTGGQSGTGGGCPAEWMVAPTVDPPIAVPDGGGGVLLHAGGTGTQNYTCSSVAVDGGTSYAWVFTGPQADLADCAMHNIGKHFASDGGPGAPEWLTTSDGTYVIGKKVAAETPDGGSGAIPWLLLQAQAHGGTGTLSHADYIQRVRTNGGLAPSTGCDASSVGMTQDVPYTADYYFFGM